MQFSLSQEDNPILSWLPFIGNKTMIFSPNFLYTGDSDEGPNSLVWYSFTKNDYYLITFYYPIEHSYREIEKLTSEGKIFCDNLKNINFDKGIVRINDLTEFSWDYLIINSSDGDGYHGSYFKFYNVENEQPIVNFVLPETVIKINPELRGHSLAPNDQFIFASTRSEYCHVYEIAINRARMDEP